MYIESDFDFEDLERVCWGYAEDTLAKVKDEGKEEELMNYLKESFNDIGKAPMIDAVNDFLWFDDDAIFDALGIK